MKALAITQVDVGKAIHRERSVVSKILGGKQQIQLDEVKPLAGLLQVSVLEILYRAGLWGDGSPFRVVAAPILNRIDAGKFATVFDGEPPHSDKALAVEYGRSTVFALKVEGDSMDRVAPEGSYVVVDYSRKEPKDMDLAVFRRGGEATFKRFRRNKAGTWLEPDSTNSRHGPIIPGDAETIEIIGCVIDVRPAYDGGRTKLRGRAR